MKKYVLNLLIIAMLISLFACSKENTNKNDTESSISPTGLIVGTASPSPTTDNSSVNNNQDENITLEDVMNHPVTPENEFVVRDKDNGCCEIADYSGSDSIVVIPETIDGMKVIGIRHEAFYLDKNIVGIKLSNTIEYVDYEAFRMAKKLKIFVSGTNLKKISSGAFFDCKNLSEIKLNEGIEFLGVGAFGSCVKLKSLFMPDSVTEIMSLGIEYEDFTIYGKEGSQAEIFALENNYNFVPVS